VSRKIDRTALNEAAIVRADPPRTGIDRTMGLPTRLYVATAACYFGFLLVLSLALMEPRLAIPMAICVLFVAMFAGVVAKWVRMDPPNSASALSWAAFQRKGMFINTGHIAARDAIAQVMTVPLMILLWGVFIALLVASID
jgi:hypothetical protein